MRALVSRFGANPPYSKLLEWFKLLAVTGSAQVVVQAIGFISAIVIIRLLPTHEYALYTLANTMLANLMILGDSGIANGVLSEGGKVWQDKKKLGEVIASGLSLRHKFALFSLLAMTAPFFYLLHHHGAGWSTSILIVLSVIPAFYASTIGSLYEVAPKLNQAIVPLQKIQLSAAIGRMLLIISSLFALPMTIVATLSAGFAQIWTNSRTVEVSKLYATHQRKADPFVKKRLLRMSYRMLPEAIYICISGQLTIWLISFFGSTAAVAEAGALMRLTTFINLFSILFATLIVPRFARMLHDGLLLRRYVQLQIAMFALATIAMFCVGFFSKEILWVLGAKYQGLRTELILMMIGSSVYVMGQSCFLLCASRTWIINPALSIPLSICTIAISALLIEVTSLTGLFKLNIVVASVHFLMHSGYGFFKILKK